MFLGLLSIPLALLAPLPLKIAVDSVIGSQPPPDWLRLFPMATWGKQGLLLAVLTLSLSIAALTHLRGLAIWRLSSYAGERLICEFRGRLFHHFQRLSIGYHEGRGTADPMYRLQQDAAAIKHIPIDGCIPFVTALLMFVGMVTVTTVIDWQLAAVALTAAPILFVLTRVCGRRLRAQWACVKGTESRAMGVAHEVFGAVRLVKAFGTEAQEQARFASRIDQCRLGHNRLAGIASGFDFGISMVIACGTTAALCIGVRHVEQGLLTLGEFLLVMAYLAQLYGPLETLTKKIAELQSSLAGVERAFAVLDAQPEPAERPWARPLVRARGGVVFHDVSFAYDGRPTLHRVTCTIPPGARVAIVGTTGAGKTTLLNLLMRFYDPTGGRILLDGIDLRDYRLADLRRQFAIVLQEPVLLSTTIAENIRYGRPDSTAEEIAAAARAAQAHEFIERLPEGYQTPVGERGAKLSGGERQRIALARAFLRDAPILVLDEPTSALDVGTESAILEGLESLMRGRTTFVITHRLSVLRHCDLRLTLEHGRLRHAVQAAQCLPEPVSV